MTGVIVQARLGSTRLPGKVLLPAAGQPLLGHLLERLKACQRVDAVIVATTSESRDEAIVEYCNSLNIPVYRGSEQDVLDRYYRAAREFGIQTVVRVTSDCPLIDPSLIDEQLLFFRDRSNAFDLMTNRHPLTYPDGLDFDIIPAASLSYVWRHASDPRHREHTVPYFWDMGLRVYNFEDPRNLFAKHRWTLDYPEDYQLIRTIIEDLRPNKPLFGTDDILSYLEKKPELPLLNAKYIA